MIKKLIPFITVTLTTLAFSLTALANTTYKVSSSVKNSTEVYKLNKKAKAYDFSKSENAEMTVSIAAGSGPFSFSSGSQTTTNNKSSNEKYEGFIRLEFQPGEGDCSQVCAAPTLVYSADIKMKVGEAEISYVVSETPLYLEEVSGANSKKSQILKLTEDSQTTLHSLGAGLISKMFSASLNLGSEVKAENVVVTGSPTTVEVTKKKIILKQGELNVSFELKSLK